MVMVSAVVACLIVVWKSAEVPVLAIIVEHYMAVVVKEMWEKREI